MCLVKVLFKSIKGRINVKMNFRYFSTRMVRFIVSLYIIATITFFILKLAPGSPITQFIGPYFNSEQAETLKKQFGLDKPLYIQYFKYIVSISVLKFGTSLRYQTSVAKLIMDRIPNSLLLLIPTLFITYILGIFWGIFTGAKRNSRFEYLSILVALIGRAVPTFWVGMVAITVFCFKLGWFPSGGIVSPGVQFHSMWSMMFSSDFLSHLVVPLTTYVFYLIGLPFLVMRNSMLENISKDFITMHRLCGLSERKIILRAARNSMLPVVTVVALGIGYIFGGAPVIETVFSWPGVGLLLVEAVNCRDYPLAQACFLIIGASMLFMNFISDMLYGMLDPRISAERRFK